MIKKGQISSIEGEKYKVVFADLEDMVTLPLSRLVEMTEIKISDGEQTIEQKQKKFEVGDNVLVAFVDDYMQNGYIIGKIDGDR